MASDTPDPRATVELLTRLERVKEKLVPPICVYEEEDAALAEVVIDALPSIIRDLRRLVDLEMEAKADAAHIAALEKEVEQLRGEPGAGEERLAEYEAALHAIQSGKMPADNKHPQGEYFSMAMRFHKIAKDALAHREGQ